jgi:hypothetical protein
MESIVDWAVAHETKKHKAGGKGIATIGSDQLHLAQAIRNQADSDFGWVQHPQAPHSGFGWARWHGLSCQLIEDGTACGAGVVASSPRGTRGGQTLTLEAN